MKKRTARKVLKRIYKEKSNIFYKKTTIRKAYSQEYIYYHDITWPDVIKEADRLFETFGSYEQPK